MFKFIKETEDTSEIIEDKHLLPFESIESSEDISVEDAMNFWDTEFDVKYQEYEENYSQYLTEIYNNAEDDFGYNFEINDELNEAISKFDSEEWNHMTDGEKIDAINNVKELVSKELGLSSVPETKYFVDDWGPNGFYDAYSNTININIEKSFLSDSKEMLNTIIHELRHAFQWERADCLETREDFLYRCNIENYIDAYKSFYAYEDQYVEVDARAYADALIKTYEEAVA